MPKTEAEKAALAEELAGLSLMELAHRYGKLDRAQGVLDGWYRASAHLKHLAGVAYSNGYDKEAAELRRVGDLLLQDEHMEIVRKERDELWWAEDTAILREIARRSGGSEE